MTIKSADKCIYRRELYRMRQEEGETFSHWVARLNNKMRLCKFKITCMKEVCRTMMNYGEDMVESFIIAEMFDSDHRARILSNPMACNTYDNKLKLALMETMGESSTSNKRSEYLQNKRPPRGRRRTPNAATARPCSTAR